MSDEYEGQTLTADRRPENQIVCELDAFGRVCAVHHSLTIGDGFFATARELFNKYPLDPADIVMPPGWRTDEDGRGLSLMEMQQCLTTHTKVAA